MLQGNFREAEATRRVEARQGLKEISVSSLGKKLGDLVKTLVAFYLYQLFLQMSEVRFTLATLPQTPGVLTGRPHPPCWGQRPQWSMCSVS